MMKKFGEPLIFKSKAIQGFSSIIIPVYKDYLGLEDTLESLSTQSVERTSYEIIVCNDGGNQDISNICKKYMVLEISVSRNMGSYYARNRGIEVSKGEFIGFVDADIKVNKRWVETALSGLRQYDYITGPVDIDAQKVNTLVKKFELFTALNMHHFFYNYHFAPTANLWVKRTVFIHNQAFDERLFSSGDKEFGERIYKAESYSMNYIDNLSVVHPPRNYKQLKNKTKRVAEGIVDLQEFYPDRYNKIKPVNCIYKAFFKPWKFILKYECKNHERVILYLIHRWNFFLHNFYIIRYLKLKSKINKVIEHDVDIKYFDHAL